MKKSIGKGTEYSRIYSDFLGVDFSGLGTNVSPRRMAYSENLYRDYNAEGAGVIESVPGYRRLYELGERINGIFTHKPSEGESYLIIHAGDKIYRRIQKGSSPVNIGNARDVKSRGFSLGKYFYLLDGENILRIGKSGGCERIGEDIEPYVPVLYHNGSPYEQRNLLSDKFKEQYTLSDVRDFSYGTEGLKYSITDDDLMLCSVVGVEDNYEGAIHIPSRIKIGENSYTVHRIADYAFAYNEKITEIHTGDGLKEIGSCAFRHCHNLERVYLSDTVVKIASGAFADCARLDSIHLGFALSEIGVSTFTTCPSLTSVSYTGGEEDYRAISGIEALANVTVSYNVNITELTVKLPVFSECRAVNSVRLNRLEHSFELTLDGERVTAVTVRLADGMSYNGATVEIEGSLSELRSHFGAASDEREPVLSAEAIKGCTIAELFDGRIFLSGNPNLPNTVFYSTLDITGRVNPLYFGELNYFSDGLGGYSVVSLLAVRDSLAVFKSGDDGSGSIFYHAPTDTGDALVPKIYPAKSIHSGFFGCGAALSFLDDPVFISPLGLSALEATDIKSERCIVTRSHNVNSRLLKEDLSKATLTEWLGYLVLGVNGKIFLADSRATFTHEGGGREYEWFMITPVGSYENSTRIYRYSSVSSVDEVLVHPNADGIAEGTVYSFTVGGQTVLYVNENGKKYCVHPTEERIGGDFSPANVFHSDSELLYFGTDAGVVMIFNNDLYGVAPFSLESKEDFSYGEYLREWGGKLHPEYYSFDYHAPRYALSTAYDDCSIPHLTKSTVKNSLVVKCRGYGGNIRLEVGTDRNKYSELAHFPGNDFSFTELDFSTLSFAFSEYSTIPLREKERGWVEKQISVYQDDYASPIGIYSIAYRYTVKGRIKSN